MTRVVILGAGDMGTAMCTPLTERHEVRLWGTPHDGNIITALRAGQPHPRLGMRVDDRVLLYSPENLPDALAEAEIVVIAVSSQAVRPVAEAIAPLLNHAQVLVILSKGLEQSESGASVLPLSRVVAEYTPVPVVAVGGPGIAREVAFAIPTAAVFGSASRPALELTRQVFDTPGYLVQTTEDLAGVELAAALKNAFAMSFGMVDGLEKATGRSHANLRAALLPQAMVELRDLVVSFGGLAETVYGLAGLGDLQVTATAGRNRLLGERIGAGSAAADAVRDLGAEGITTEGFAVTNLGYQLALALSDGDEDAAHRQFPMLAGLHRIAHASAPPADTLWAAVRAGAR